MPKIFPRASRPARPSLTPKVGIWGVPYRCWALRASRHMLMDISLKRSKMTVGQYRVNYTSYYSILLRSRAGTAEYINRQASSKDGSSSTLNPWCVPSSAPGGAAAVAGWLRAAALRSRPAASSLLLMVRRDCWRESESLDGMASLGTLGGLCVVAACPSASAADTVMAAGMPPPPPPQFNVDNP